MYASICLFTYNRLNETESTIEALTHNYLANKSDLFIFSDGPKNEKESSQVYKVRQYLQTVSGFKSISIFESPVNKGLANSIISGVTQIIEEYGKVIVLEDDLITSPNFLDYMNQALDFYQSNDKIFSISGYTFDLPSLKLYPKDYYLSYRASSWGWATWKSRWDTIDWDVKDYKSFKKNPIQQIKFMRGGSDMPRMLKNQMQGKIDSWAIRWCFSQFINNQFTIYPTISKICNIGFGQKATHTFNGSRFATKLDPGENNCFHFDNDLSINAKLIKEFRFVFSFFMRIKNKLFS